MLGDPEEMNVRARRTLLDALQILDRHRDAVILVGAQAVYLHVGEVEFAVAPATKDADLALDPVKLTAEPKIEEVLRAAGFESPEHQIGIWRNPHTLGQIDFLVPEALAGSKGRRAAKLEAQGNTLARRAEGLEGTIVDNRAMEITSLEGNDDRRFRIAVAGPGALLVAKLYKLGERRDQTNRLNNKDALDVFRLLRGIPTERMVASFHKQFAAAISASVAQVGVRLLEELFGTESALGSAMAGQAVGVLDDAAIVTASVTALAADLLTVIGNRR